ncbi:hypothetical protein R1flu_001986 [Riccia fluitans]|uniref:Uncharacterized protein n=1 Tax=Riccia fluitans TaxID=41844 RepID=A0ABD1Y585_9MARC
MGRAPCCDKANVKKGPWSPEEDGKLKSFIEQNGTGGNWITLPSKAGLKRCGKSCRLRWINYLRPDIKHGSFTEEEERTIYRLHAQIGSRWSLIAGQLPGRTDNDIKNYWNTRLKKKLVERESVPQPPHVDRQSDATQDQVASLPHRQEQLSCIMNEETQNSQLYLQHGVMPGKSRSIPLLAGSRSMRNQLGDENQQTVMAFANAGVDPRLMFIENSFRSLIVPDESSASGSGSDGSLMIDHAYYDHNTAASPASSCSNLSSDRKAFVVQSVDSDFTETGNESYDNLGPRVTAASMLNTSVLASSLESPHAQPPASDLQNSIAATASFLPAHRFDDHLLLGESFCMYGRPQPFTNSEVMVVSSARDDIPPVGSGRVSGDWWNSMNLVSTSRGELNLGINSGIAVRGGISSMTKWPVSTPRCGTENIYTFPQSQLASQARIAPDPFDGRCGYVNDSVLSELII